MFLLDTNVLSEMMKGPRGESRGLAWLGGCPTAELFTSSVCIAELRIGCGLLEPDRKRRELEAAIENVVATLSDVAILSFDRAAAHEVGLVMENRRRAGRRIELPDAMIAAIARVNGATIVTRNTADFDALDLALVDLWSA
jgi:toxin FitB